MRGGKCSSLCCAPTLINENNLQCSLLKLSCCITFFLPVQYAVRVGAGTCFIQYLVIFGEAVLSVLIILPVFRKKWTCSTKVHCKINKTKDWPQVGKFRVAYVRNIYVQKCFCKENLYYKNIKVFFIRLISWNGP